MKSHKTPNRIHTPKIEHSVPWFWPMAAAIEFEEKGLETFQDNMRFIGEAAKIETPPAPEWATENRVILDLDTMRLRDFSAALETSEQTPVLIDAPYAGHSSTIADYASGQSLVDDIQNRTLRGFALHRFHRRQAGETGDQVAMSRDSRYRAGHEDTRRGARAIR